MTSTTSGARFEIGAIRITPGVENAVNQDDIFQALVHHMGGDWGEVDAHDWERNDEAVEQGHRIVSSYTAHNGTKFWVITEHDRSATTFLLPREY